MFLVWFRHLILYGYFAKLSVKSTAQKMQWGRNTFHLTVNSIERNSGPLISQLVSSRYGPAPRTTCIKVPQNLRSTSAKSLRCLNPLTVQVSFHQHSSLGAWISFCEHEHLHQLLWSMSTWHNAVPCRDTWALSQWGSSGTKSSLALRVGLLRSGIYSPGWRATLAPLPKLAHWDLALRTSAQHCTEPSRSGIKC